MQFPSTLSSREASGNRERKRGISVGKHRLPKGSSQRDRGPAGNSNPGYSAVGTESKELSTMRVMTMFAVGRESPVVEGLGLKASCSGEGVSHSSLV